MQKIQYFQKAFHKLNSLPSLAAMFGVAVGKKKKKSPTVINKALTTHHITN